VFITKHSVEAVALERLEVLLLLQVNLVLVAMGYLRI
jgi:hypothetical protein